MLTKLLKRFSTCSRRPAKAGRRAAPRRKCRPLPLRLEPLEQRTLLDATIALVGDPYLVDAQARRLDATAVPEGLPIFIWKDFQTNDLPSIGRDGTNTYIIRNQVDSEALWHPGGWSWGVGVQGTGSWSEYWGGWKTSPGQHTASGKLDDTDNFATNSDSRTWEFPFTTVAKPTVTIQATDPLAKESGTHAGIFTITRAGNLDFDMTVDYTVSGTAQPGTDYQALSGSVTIPTGQASATIGVFPLNDAGPEERESVVVTLTSEDYYAVGGTGSATVGITNNQTNVTIAATDPLAIEATQHAGIFTVTRAGDTTDPLTVNYTVGGTAEAGKVYTALPGSVTIPAGASSTTIGVVPIQDHLPQPRQTVIVTLTSNETADDSNYTAGNPNSATVSIKDADTVATIVATKPNASKNGPTPGEFTVTRQADLVDPLTVEYTVSGDAGAGVDYVALPGSVVIPAGAASVTIPVTPIAGKDGKPLSHVIVTLVPNETGSEYSYTVGPQGSATVTITGEGVQEASDASVEGRAFSSAPIMLPRPFKGVTYDLHFLAESGPIPRGGGWDGITRTFTWSVDHVAGFNLVSDPPDPEGHATQSKALGTISNDVVPGAVYIVTVDIHTSSPFFPGGVFQQAISFYNVAVAPTKPVVLTGGLDDGLHQTSFKINDGKGGIPSGDHLRLALESNQDYGQKKKPQLFERDGQWFFRSSDRAFAADHDTDFTVGGYVTPALTGKEVKVATTQVAQDPGDYRVTIVSPADGQIYPNGAIKVRVQHIFEGKTTNHNFTVKLGDGQEQDFQIRGSDAGSSGLLVTEIIKLPPKVTDPTNKLPHYVTVKIIDPLIYGESGSPMDFGQKLSLTGEQPSFWRSSPNHGKGQRGTFWNWATVVDQPGSGFKGSQSSDRSGTYGESETWHGKDYATDENVTALGKVQNQISATRNEISTLERDWKTWQDKITRDAKDYEEFKAGFASFQQLKGIYDTITALLEDGKKLAKTVKELEAQIKGEKDPTKRSKLIEQLQKTKEHLEKLQKQVEQAVAERDKILNSLSGTFKITAPAALARLASELLENMDQGADLRRRATELRAKLNDETDKLTGFIEELGSIIQSHPQKSGDPDESLKREYLEDSRLEDLLNNATAIRDSIRDNQRKAEQLNLQISALNKRIDEADLRATLAALEVAMKQALERVELPSFLKPLDKWLHIKDKLGEVINGFVGQNLFQTLDELVGTMKDTVNAGVDLSKALRDTATTAHDAVPDTTHLYRVWITPTVEFPAEVLENLKPKQP